MLSEKNVKWVKKKIKKLWFELVIFFISFTITIIALISIFKNHKNDSQNEEMNIKTQQESHTLQKTKYFVDISGAVNKPGVYEVTFGARLKDVLKLSGGLSDEADRMFFARNFNLARFVSDQEKIHIPSISEINAGLFTETARNIDYISAKEIPTQTDEKNQVNNKININQASVEELDQLPGIGQAITKKIIDNRPFSSLNELVDKKIINKSTFEKIKDLITL